MDDYLKIKKLLDSEDNKKISLFLLKFLVKVYEKYPTSIRVYRETYQTMAVGAELLIFRWNDDVYRIGLNNFDLTIFGNYGIVGIGEGPFSTKWWQFNPSKELRKVIKNIMEKSRHE